MYFFFFLVSLHRLLDCLSFLFTSSPYPISKRFIFFVIVEIIILLVCVFCFRDFLLISHPFLIFSSLLLSQTSFHSSFDLHNFLLTSSPSFFLKRQISFANVEVIISLIVHFEFFLFYVFFFFLILLFFNLLFSVSLSSPFISSNFISLHRYLPFNIVEIISSQKSKVININQIEQQMR